MMHLLTLVVIVLMLDGFLKPQYIYMAQGWLVCYICCFISYLIRRRYHH